jgi:Zn-dependent protease with chaperone function
MYALIVVALAALGAGAAQVLFIVDDLGHASAVQDCLLDDGIRLGDPALTDVTGSTSRLAAFAACADPHNRSQALVMTTGVAAILALAWLLMLGSGWSMRRRLRHRASTRTGPLVDAVTARFEHWCDTSGLTGRHRPTLLIARPGRLTDQAFTTALPFARPTVVIPIGYAHLDPGQLDVVLLHELAHVRSRDLTWASATWWAGWLNLPVLLAAILPLLAYPARIVADFRYTLLLALVLSLASLTLRSAVLRRREQAADAYAIRVLGDGDALRAVATASAPPDTVASPGRALIRTVRRWASTHPAPDVRAATTGATSDGWEGGFAVAAATAILAVFTFKSLDTILIDISGFTWPWADLPGDVSLGVAAAVWALTLVPAWTRRARHGDARRAAAVTGSALGLVAGYLIPAPGAIVPEGVIDLIGVRLGPLLWLAAVALGVGVVAAALAAAAAAAVRGRRAAVIAAVIGAAVTMCTAISTAMTLIVAHVRTPVSGYDRVLLAQHADVEWFAWTPACLLICAAVLAYASRRTAPPFAPVSAVAVTGALVATVATQIRIHTADRPDSIFLLMTQREWMCAVTGWVAAIVVLRSGPRPAIAVALLTGAAVSTFVGVVQFGRDLVGGHGGHNVHNLAEFVTTPIWLTCVLITVTFTATGDLIRWRPASPVAVGIRATAAAAILAVAVATGVAAPVTVAGGDWNRFTAAVAADAVRNTPSEPTPPPNPVVSYPPGTADPGRVLTPAAITTALASVRRALPKQWKPAATAADVPQTGVEPATCAAMFTRDDATENAQVRVAHQKTTLKLPDSVMPPVGASLVLSVISFASPADAARYADDARTETAECPRWTSAVANTDDGRARFTIRADGATGSAYPGFRGLLTEEWSTYGEPGVVAASESWVVIGHNVVSVEAVYAYLGASAVPAARVREIRGFVDTALASIVASLGRDPNGP